MDLTLNFLELRGTYMDLRRGIREVQHKGKASTLQRHINRTLCTHKKITIPSDTLWVVVNKIGVVKFYNSDYLPRSVTEGLLRIHIYRKGGKWLFSDLQLNCSVDKPKRRTLKANKMIDKGTYYLTDGRRYLNAGDYALEAYRKFVYDKVTIDEIDKSGDGLVKGVLTIKREDLRCFTFLGYDL